MGAAIQFSLDMANSVLGPEFCAQSRGGYTIIMRSAERWLYMCTAQRWLQCVQPKVAICLAQRWLQCVQPRSGLGPELSIYVSRPEVATVCSAQRWLYNIMFSPEVATVCSVQRWLCI